MAVTTKGIDPNGNGGGGFTPKNLVPGNHKCVLNSIKMQRAEHIKDKEEYQIVLNLEGPAIGGTFQGFFIDMQDQSKGRHAGQTSMVKLSEYNYRDGETKAGHPILRDEEILKDLNRLCNELGDACIAWYNNIDARAFPTVEDLIATFNTEKPFAGVVLHYCIAGKKYTNKAGYPAYELFLPRKSDLGRPYCKDETKVQKFFASVHVKESKPKDLKEGFAATTEVNNENKDVKTETPTINTNNIEEAKAVIDDKNDELPFSLT